MPKKAKTKTSLAKTIVKYMLVVPAVCGLIENLFLMAKDEAAQTKRKLVFLFIVAMFAIALLFSIWGCLTGLVILFFMYLQLSLIASVLITMVINLVFFLIACLILSLTKVDVFLPETRRFIREMLMNS